MALVNNIQTVKQFVKVNYSNQNSELPNFEATEIRYLLPLIGQSIYNNLKTAADNNDSNNMLLKLARQFVVPMTYYNDLPIINAAVGDKGLYVSVSENYQPISKWGFEKVREYFADSSSAALDILISYLWANKSSLNWSVLDNRKLLFNNGTQFTEYYRIYQPHRNFEELVIPLKTITDEFICSELTEAFYTELLNYNDSDADTLSAIKLLKKAAAHKTIEKACETLSVKISNKGFTTVLAYDTDIINPNETAATDNQIINLKNSVGKTAANYMQQLKEFLNAKASDSKFSTYFNSSVYKAPSTVEKSINESTNSFIL